MPTLLLALLLAAPGPGPVAGPPPKAVPQDSRTPPGPAPGQLPGVPEGWGFERLDFPLDFAPEIPWRGFEERAFAPGMFTEGAPDYWSYAVALRVAEDSTKASPPPLEVDAEVLDDFLERYYRGLCAAVGGSRGLEIDPASIRAEVTGGGAEYLATVHLIDAFVTGEPLELRLELLVQPDPGGGPWTELFAMASPAAAGAPVRDALRELAAAWRAARPVPVFLNHVYMVPDLATYEALRASPFLRELAVMEERTTHRGDLSYTGLYLYGETTYFEFLKPDPSIGFAPGATGVAFGVEVPGGLARMAAALEAAGVTTFAGKRTRDLPAAETGGGEQVPWFDILGIQGATTTQRLQLFAMEYDPAFLERWNPRADGLAGRIDRAAVLARYADVIGAPAQPALADIAWLSIAGDEREYARCVQVAAALGHGVHDRLQHVEGLHHQGPGFSWLAAGELERPGGLMGFAVRLSRPVELPEPLDFGQIELRRYHDQLMFEFTGISKEDQ